jgi:hypothetical protein
MAFHSTRVGTQPRSAPFLLLRCFEAASLLDRQNCFWASLAESLEVELFDKLRQGQLPRLPLVIIDLAQLSRVHPQFAGHVDLGVTRYRRRENVLCVSR